MLAKLVGNIEKLGFPSLTSMMTDGLSGLFEGGGIYLFLALIYHEHETIDLGGDAIEKRRAFFEAADAKGMLPAAMAGDGINFFFMKLIKLSESSPEILVLMRPKEIRNLEKRQRPRKTGKTSSMKSAASPETGIPLGLVHSEKKT